VSDTPSAEATASPPPPPPTPPPSIPAPQPPGQPSGQPWGAPIAGVDAPIGYELPTAGELTPGWQWIVRLTWLAVFIGLMSVWKASRDIGLPTWWLGPFGDPMPLPVSLLPFLVPTAMVMLTFSRSRAMPWFGLVGACAMAGVGVADLSPYPGLGVIELVIAAAAGAVSVASIGGRYRAGPASPPADADGDGAR